MPAHSLVMPATAAHRVVMGVINITKAASGTISTLITIAALASKISPHNHSMLLLLFPILSRLRCWPLRHSVAALKARCRAQGLASGGGRMEKASFLLRLLLFSLMASMRATPIYLSHAPMHAHQHLRPPTLSFRGSTSSRLSERLRKPLHREELDTDADNLMGKATSRLHRLRANALTARVVEAVMTMVAQQARLPASMCRLVRSARRGEARAMLRVEKTGVKSLTIRPAYQRCKLPQKETRTPYRTGVARAGGWRAAVATPVSGEARRMEMMAVLMTATRDPAETAALCWESRHLLHSTSLRRHRPAGCVQNLVQETAVAVEVAAAAAAAAGCGATLQALRHARSCRPPCSRWCGSPNRLSRRTCRKHSPQVCEMISCLSNSELFPLFFFKFDFALFGGLFKFEVMHVCPQFFMTSRHI